MSIYFSGIFLWYIYPIHSFHDPRSGNNGSKSFSEASARADHPLSCFFTLWEHKVENYHKIAHVFSSWILLASSCWKLCNFICEVDISAHFVLTSDFSRKVHATMRKLSFTLCKCTKFCKWEPQLLRDGTSRCAQLETHNYQKSWKYCQKFMRIKCCAVNFPVHRISLTYVGKV